MLIELPSKNEKLKFGGEMYFKFCNGDQKLDESLTCLIKMIFVAEKVILKLMIPFEQNNNSIINKAGKFYLETLEYLFSWKLLFII